MGHIKEVYFPQKAFPGLSCQTKQESRKNFLFFLLAKPKNLSVCTLKFARHKFLTLGTSTGCTIKQVSIKNF